MQMAHTRANTMSAAKSHRAAPTHGKDNHEGQWHSTEAQKHSRPRTSTPNRAHGKAPQSNFVGSARQPPSLRTRPMNQLQAFQPAVCRPYCPECPRRCSSSGQTPTSWSRHRFSSVLCAGSRVPVAVRCQLPDNQSSGAAHALSLRPLIFIWPSTISRYPCLSSSRHAVKDT